MFRSTVLVLLILSCGCSSAPEVFVPPFEKETSYDPATLFLTWWHDPTTTMGIQWLDSQTSPEKVVIWWSPAGRDEWKSIEGVKRPFPKTDLDIHVAELKGLEPGADYRFRIGLVSPEYRFRTMPAKLTEPLRFAIGGDAGPNSKTEAVNRQAARRSPRFALLGGDLAYANGKSPEKWQQFLAMYGRQMVTPDGFKIPLLVTIGNHERSGWTRDSAPFFFALFDGRFPKTSYDVVDFGDYMSIWLLDSGHVSPVDQAQKKWLDQTMKARQKVPHRFVVYHVPAYPSHRDWTGAEHWTIRKNWCPIFERYQVDAVFENHDHTYKRTHRIRNEKKHPEGILYLGDGAWGQLRTVKTPDELWFLARSASSCHFIMTTIHGTEREHVAISDEGSVIDRYPER